MSISRARIIAGPNGSGKTTLFYFLQSQLKITNWLNADEILNYFTRNGFLDYSVLGFVPTQSSFKKYCITKEAKLYLKAFTIKNEIDKISFGKFSINYVDKTLSNIAVAFLTNFFRYFLVQKELSFTTETVLSHPSKLLFFKSLKKKGYKTYLYFVATQTPEINVKRIKSRVEKGGHNVPASKTRERFFRSILLLKDCINLFDKIFLFDNSTTELKMIMSIENGKKQNVFVDNLPNWVNTLNIK